MEAFASLDDLNNLYRPLRREEEERAEALLKVVSDTLRMEAENAGKDLDQMAQESEAYRSVLISVVCDVVARTLMTSTDQEPMIQASEAAMGYSWSGTYLVPGGGLFIKKSELKKLGLKKQRFGVIDFYGGTQGD